MPLPKLPGSCGKRHAYCRVCRPATAAKMSLVRAEINRRYSWNRGKTKDTDSRVAANGHVIGVAKMGHTHNSSPEVRAKLRAARLRQVFPKKNTRIERELRAEFNQRKLSFKQHTPIFSRFVCDFVFPESKLIVEADGYPWHVAKDHEPLYAAARAEGWEVWRFPDQLIFPQRKLIGQLVEFRCRKRRTHILWHN